jgi:hypothetical protein
MISEEILNIKNRHFTSLPYMSPDGRFFTYNNQNYRASQSNICREMFSQNFKRRSRYLGFSKHKINIKKINEFWEQIEDRLGIENKTVFHKSDHKDDIIMKISPFWTQNGVRRGFATLFLRCAAKHYHGDLNKSFTNYPLMKPIYGAVRWFLNGNTEPTYKNCSGGGLVNKFVKYEKTNCWEDGKKFLRKDYKKLLVKKFET